MIDRFCGGCAGIATVCLLLFALLIISAVSAFGMSKHKGAAARLIADHLIGHPECEARSALPILDSIEIVETFHVNPNVHGWIHEGKIFINTNKGCKWTDRKIVLFLIHELLHACGHCPNDSIRSYDKPICKMFGKDIYHSMDLTKAIKDHFKEGKHGSHN